MAVYKTLIELFDECQIENVAGCLAFEPENIIFVGFEDVLTPDKKNAFRSFLNQKNISVNIKYIEVKRFDFDDISNKLTYLVENNEDCCFDLTGGEDLVLAAMGTVAQKYSVPMIQIDIKTGNIIKVKNCKEIKPTNPISITIKENLSLYGGALINTGEEWDFNSEFKSDIIKLWGICKNDCSIWNKVSPVLSGHLADEPGLYTEINLKRLNAQSIKTLKLSNVLNKLKDLGIIYSYEKKDNIISFKFKNSQIKKVITKAGNILELYSYIIAKEIDTAEGNFYNDIRIGVKIDWDGKIEHNIFYKDTKNEIDLFLMRGAVPVFLSCKNGEVHKEDLYELDTVANRFGGKYAKKILLSTVLSTNSETKFSLMQRARDMNIDIIYNIHTLSKEAYLKILKDKTS